MLLLKWVSLCWLPSPVPLLLIGIEMKQTQQKTPGIINTKCAVCKALLP